MVKGVPDVLKPSGRTDLEALVGERGRAVVPSSIEEASAPIECAGPGVISLAEGTPPAAELPSAALARAIAAALAQPGSLAYGPSRGEPMLLDAIDGLATSLGLPSRHSVVTAGATQGLFLALHVLSAPGDVVLADTATYGDMLSACASLQLRASGVADDADGMIPAALDAAIRQERGQGRRPAAIYLIPTAHNPLGITLGSERRRDLVAVARAHEVAVVEDDTYALFDSAGAPSLAALAPDLVVRLDSLSKLLGPGLRIGWISGPPGVMTAVAGLKAAVDVCAPVAIQWAAARLLPEIRALARAQMEGLAARRAAMLAALDDEVGALAAWTRPRAGYFIWLKPADGRPGRMLAAQALAAGVAVLPGAIFSPEGRDDAVRLSCANRTPAEIREAITRLRRALLDA